MHLEQLIEESKEPTRQITGRLTVNEAQRLDILLQHFNVGKGQFFAACVRDGIHNLELRMDEEADGAPQTEEEVANA